MSDGKKHSIERVSDDGLVYRQTSRGAAGRFTISKTYATDPARDTLLIDVAFSAPRGFYLYVLYDPALKNSGMGDTGYTQDDALVTEKPGVGDIQDPHLRLAQHRLCTLHPLATRRLSKKH